VALDQFQGLGAGGQFLDDLDVIHHQVAHAWGDVAQVDRQVLLEAGEDGVDAGIGVAAAGGDVALLAPGFLEGGVGDG